MIKSAMRLTGGGLLAVLVFPDFASLGMEMPGASADCQVLRDALLIAVGLLVRGKVVSIRGSDSDESGPKTSA